LSHPNPSTALARTVIDELAHRGVRLFVVSPGSRSAALAIAAAVNPDVETRVVVDERSAAFHALGASRASGRPAAVVSTSGSAPTHFFPAIVEADASCVPLVAVSADRPAELQGVGANQTMDQAHLFGDKVRAYAGIEAPDGSTDANLEWRGTVARLLGSADGPTPGPVHLNVRFREPTVPATDDGRTRGETYPFATPRAGESGVTPLASDLGEGEPEYPVLDGERGLIVAGDGVYDRPALTRVSGELGWPVLATAMSGMRGGEVVTAYHHLLADGVSDSLRPLTVVAVGAIGPSSRLETLVASATWRVRIDRWGRSIDPGRDATHRLHGDVVALLARVDNPAPSGWRKVWLETDRLRREEMNGLLGRAQSMTGAGVAAALDYVSWETLVVSSSLPIREVDAHLTRGGSVLANRGLSGVDGFVSTALGVAGENRRVLAVSGDISLLHDGNGFIHDGDIDLTLVVIDNGGGGLFDSLPQARHAPQYERLFVSPHHRRIEDLAQLHGLRYQEADDAATLRRLCEDGLGRPGVDVIRVAVDRGDDLAMRDQLDG
jgi:2-succinyl-5-enolpyruvyl-6-hydroxy-3-cyclohexene-1-carboxylate synthase